jgi:hypothetical protein
MGGEPVRLHVRGQILGYKRSKANQHNHTALIKVCPLFSRGSAPATAAQLWGQLHILIEVGKAYIDILVISVTDMPGQTPAGGGCVSQQQQHRLTGGWQCMCAMASAAVQQQAVLHCLGRPLSAGT